MSQSVPMSQEEWLERDRSSNQSNRQATKPEEDFLSSIANVPGKIVDVISNLPEAFSGRERATKVTDRLPDYAGMPELNELSWAGMKTGIGTTFTDQDETVKVIQSNFPGVRVGKDKKGNYILQSSKNGEYYALKPGFQLSDIPRLAATVLSFTPAGKSATILGALGKGAATQGAIETSQAATGGDFDPENVAFEGLLGTIPGVAKAGYRGLKDVTEKGRKVLTPRVDSDEVWDAVKSGKEYGVDILTTDVKPPTGQLGRRIQAISETIPLAGTGERRLKQEGQRVLAVRNFLTEHGATDVAELSDDVMKSLLAKRSADRINNVKIKDEIIDRLDSRNKPLDKSFLKVVPMPQTVNKIDEIIETLQKNNTDASMEVIEKLKLIKGRGTEGAQGRSLRELESFRRDVMSNAFKNDAANPIAVSVRDLGEKALQDVYKSFVNDMGNFIEATGGIADRRKWAVANGRLSEAASDLKNQALKTVLRKGDVTPEVIQRLLFNGKPSEVRALYNSLPPEAQANARAAILAKAAKETAVKLGDGEIVSPDQFAKNVKKMGDSVGVFFTGSDLDNLNGLMRLLDITKRASEVPNITRSPSQTATQLLPIVGMELLISLFSAPGMATAVAGTVGGLARMYESKAVRNAILKLRQTKSGSDEEMNVINALKRQASPEGIAKQRQNNQDLETLSKSN